jgi:hypothetical protein
MKFVLKNMIYVLFYCKLVLNDHETEKSALRSKIGSKRGKK